MAWYNVTYKCGHQESVQLYGKDSSRENYIEWAKFNKLCPDCYREAKKEERRQENERSASLASTLGFVALSGSEKQIAWATSIRQKVYEALLEKSHDTINVVPLINAETSAKWWIDHRDRDAVTILRLLVGNYPDVADACKNMIVARRTEATASETYIIQ